MRCDDVNRVVRCDFYILITIVVYFFFQAEDGIRDIGVNGVQTCALPISYVQFHTCSYIVFFFEMENNNFIKELKHVLRAFIPSENRGNRLGEFEDRSKKTREKFGSFHLLEN